MTSLTCYSIGIIILVLSFSSSTVYGHTSVNVGDYEIEAGWETEPPVVGFRNNFVFEISIPGDVEGIKTGVKSAFYNLDVTAKYGGITKQLDVNSDPKPGHYFSSVIPTKTGSMSVIFTGKIDDTIIDVEIPLQYIESTSVLDFPPKKGSSSGEDFIALKNSMRYLQEELGKIKSTSEGSIMTSDDDFGMAYGFSVLALSLSVSGVVLGITAMLKRN